MNPTLDRILGLLSAGDRRPGRMLGGFVDSLLQSFENRRVGLSDETLRAGDASVQPFFEDLYAQEVAQLRDAVRTRELGLSEAAKQELFEKVDELVRTVVVPAYVRLARRFTLRERNDFYLAPEPLHGLERLGWGGAGIALGAFAVWAPFIPLWEKEWILPFAIAGLVFPNLRRLLALRRYQADLNRLVARTDDEIWRMDLAYLTRGEGQGEPQAEPDSASPERDALSERLSSAGGSEPEKGGRAKDKLRDRGR